MKKIFTLMVALVATISCMAQTTTEYSGQMFIAVGDAPAVPIPSTVKVNKDADNNYSVELHDFNFMGQPVGDIIVSSFTAVQNEDGSISLTSTPEGDTKNIQLSGTSDIAIGITLGGGLQGNVTAKIDGNTFTLDLPLNIGMPVQVNFEGTSTTTSINNVSANDSKDAIIYNIAGQQVGKSAKGIIIKNGKKYINAQGK